jgi:molybdate transport system substrate-binding protein
MGNQFEEKKSVRISYVYGSSGSLARKIELGAPADVFLSASKRWGTYLEGRKNILPESRRALAGNSLVCVVPLSSPIRFSHPADLSRAVKISLGDPAHVPAGIYAHESLAKLKLLRNLSEKGKLIFSPNVRAALILVERKQVSAGIVYKSDAMFSKHTRMAFEFPPDTYTPIIYDGSVVSASGKKDTATAFLDFMMSKVGANVFHRWGFSPRGN